MDADTQVDLFLVVVLNSQHEVEIQEVRIAAVDFEVVDQVIQHAWRE